MKKILYADGCVLRNTSRTEQLAQAWLQKRQTSEKCTVETVVLEDARLAPLDGKTLAERTVLAGKGDFSGDCFRFARSFADADELLIAVPFWDLSFPSMLKVYLEHLCICGLTFRYSEQGIPVGMTKIRKVTYITTAGGYIGKNNFGFEYVKGLMQGLFGIADIQFISAEGLDIQGNNPQAILEDAIRNLP